MKKMLCDNCRKEVEDFIQDILDWAYVNRDTETGDVPYEELDKYIKETIKSRLGLGQEKS